MTDKTALAAEEPEPNEAFQALIQQHQDLFHQPLQHGCGGCCHCHCHCWHHHSYYPYPGPYWVDTSHPYTVTWNATSGAAGGTSVQYLG